MANISLAQVTFFGVCVCVCVRALGLSDLTTKAQATEEREKDKKEGRKRMKEEQCQRGKVFTRNKRLVPMCAPMAYGRRHFSRAMERRPQ